MNKWRILWNDLGPQLVCTALVSATLCFTAYAYEHRWCWWFGGMLVPSFCQDPPPPKCLQWEKQP